MIDLFKKSNQESKETEEMKSQIQDQTAQSDEPITQQGKAPKEVQPYLMSAEPDDLTVDFTNKI